MRELATRHSPARTGVSVVTLIGAVAGGLLSALIVGRPEDKLMEVLRAGAFAGLFTGLAMHDLTTRTIPNRMIYPAAALAVVAAWSWGAPEPAGALLGGALAFTAFAVMRAVTRGIGGGDVKFVGLVGLVVGAAELPLALTVTALSGGGAALLLLAGGRATRGTAIPYGPFIALGGAVGLLV